MLLSAKLKNCLSKSVISLIFSLRHKEGSYRVKKRKNYEKNSKTTLILFSIVLQQANSFWPNVVYRGGFLLINRVFFLSFWEINFVITIIELSGIR